MFAAGRLEKAFCTMNLAYLHKKDVGSILSRRAMKELMRRWFPDMDHSGAFHTLWNNIIDFTDKVVMGEKKLDDAEENEDVLTFLSVALEKRDYRGLCEVEGIEPSAEGVAQMCRIVLCGGEDYSSEAEMMFYEFSADEDVTLELNGSERDEEEIVPSSSPPAPEGHDSQETVDYRDSQETVDCREPGATEPGHDSEETIVYGPDSEEGDRRPYTENESDSCNTDCDRDSPAICSLPTEVSVNKSS